MKKGMLQCLITAFFLAGFHAGAQVNDNFSDGDFSANPAWTGNTADWRINAEAQLQSNNTTPNSNFYLATPNLITGPAQWEFWVRMAFNTSGANYTDVYLTASQSNLTAANTAGYFIRIGDTPDEVSLYRKDANGSSIKMIDGADGILNSSNSILRIRVIRNEANQWTLWRDLGATGAYLQEGTATDATHPGSSFFGLWVRQSTTSFVQRHFFDDFEVKPYTPDITPPAIVSLTATSPNTLDILFDELPETASAVNVLNYVVNNGVGNPVTVQPDPGNPLKMQLGFTNPFPNGISCTIMVNGVKDAAGNTLNNGSGSFLFYSAQRNDIVLNELMADPLPQVGLPDASWIELLNASTFPINLQGYRLGRNAGLSGPLPAFILNPGQMVIVCPASQVAALSPYGPTLPVTGFPALPNSGGLLWLQDASGKIMHAVDYNTSWYQNTVKAEGGWSLEMVDGTNPCTGSGNWRASNHASGGTPGKANSVAGSNRDQNPPQLISAFAPDANTLELFFNEPLDSSRSVTATGYAVSNGVGLPASISIEAALFTKATLRLSNALQPGTIYTVTVTGVYDCAGNPIGNANSVRTGLAQVPDSFDLVVNEILFNPKPQGTDYLEVYNRGNKILNAGSIFFANRGSNGSPGTPYPLNTANRLIFPGEYYAVTENPDAIRQQFTILNPSAIVQVPTMPSFPDDKGTVILLSQAGRIIDELNYDRKWHFALVDNEEGISLERIDFQKPTQTPDNWTSAAASAGFGTPGYQNSQFRNHPSAPAGSIVLNPPLFSPDNDGFEDFCLITFRMNEPGYVANVTIYDAAGRQVRVLQRNTTLAESGSFRWDGLNDKQQRVAAGNYIILFEAFNLQGNKQAIKKGVTVARKF